MWSRRSTASRSFVHPTTTEPNETTEPCDVRWGHEDLVFSVDRLCADGGDEHQPIFQPSFASRTNKAGGRRYVQIEDRRRWHVHSRFRVGTIGQQGTPVSA